MCVCMHTHTCGRAHVILACQRSDCTDSATRLSTERLQGQCEVHVSHIEYLGGTTGIQRTSPTTKSSLHDLVSLMVVSDTTTTTTTTK